jgi:hypothetical protein
LNYLHLPSDVTCNEYKNYSQKRDQWQRL